MARLPCDRVSVHSLSKIIVKPRTLSVDNLHETYRINLMSKSHKLFCRAMLDECEQYVNPLRAKLGYMTCLKCGEQIAKERKHTIVPLNKSNYVVVSDMNLLTQLNPKRTT